MRFLKRFFFLLFIVIIGVAIFSWVNLWIRPNSVGLFYNSLDASPIMAPIMVTNKKLDFNLHLKRIIPYKTKLITLPLDTQINDTFFSVYLPGTEHYSKLLNTSEETFKTDINIILQYTIDSTKIADYVYSYYETNIPLNGYVVMQHLDISIKKILISELQTSLSEKNSWTQANFQQELTDSFSPQIVSLTSHLPISITDTSFEILRIPDFELYQYILNTTKNSTSNASETTKQISQLLTQYLLFVKELGHIIDQSPSVLEIIKILPPAELKAVFQ